MHSNGKIWFSFSSTILSTICLVFPSGNTHIIAGENTSLLLEIHIRVYFFLQVCKRTHNIVAKLISHQCHRRSQLPIHDVRKRSKLVLMGNFVAHKNSACHSCGPYGDYYVVFLNDVLALQFKVRHL